MFLTTASLCALGAFAVAKTTQVVMRRFDLDVMTVLLGLGLAEWPSPAPVPREPRVREPVPDGAARPRRRAAHRALAQRTERRRAAAR